MLVHSVWCGISRRSVGYWPKRQVQPGLCHYMQVLGQLSARAELLRFLLSQMLAQQVAQQPGLCKLRSGELSDSHASSGVRCEQSFVTQQFHGLAHRCAAYAELLSQCTIMDITTWWQLVTQNA